MEQEALLIRVGLDSGTGRGYSPLFDDGRFEYIPIPESEPSIESRQYKEISGRWGGALADHAEHLANEIPHFDPEFTTYTYGDPGANKRPQLRRLSEGDLVIFYAGLEARRTAEKRLYAIGYFTVDETYDLEPLPENERIEILNQFPHNAHVKRENVTASSPRSGYHYPVIVKGKPEQSGLFDWPRPLARKDQRTLRAFENLTGFSGSLTRAGVARTTNIKNSSRIHSWLKKGAVAMIDEQSSLFSYVVQTDFGFAPNPKHGYCTLAACKPGIRSAANVGDWVLGGAPARAGQENIVFLMQIDEKLTFDEYYCDERFECKRPDSDPRGDNIYYREGGKLVQVEDPPAHDSEEDREHDTQTDAVLVGSLFWYFGEEGYEVPNHLCDDLLHAYEADGRVGHSREENLDGLRDLVMELQKTYHPGQHGAPRDGDESDFDISGC